MLIGRKLSFLHVICYIHICKWWGFDRFLISCPKSIFDCCTKGFSLLSITECNVAVKCLNKDVKRKCEAVLSLVVWNVWGLFKCLSRAVPPSETCPNVPAHGRLVPPSGDPLQRQGSAIPAAQPQHWPVSVTLCTLLVFTCIQSRLRKSQVRSTVCYTETPATVSSFRFCITAVDLVEDTVGSVLSLFEPFVIL